MVTGAVVVSWVVVAVVVAAAVVADYNKRINIMTNSSNIDYTSINNLNSFPTLAFDSDGVICFPAVIRIHPSTFANFTHGRVRLITI